MSVASSNSTETVKSCQAISIATIWLEELGNSLLAWDFQHASACFQPNGFLRDLLLFTPNPRTIRGRPKIAAYLDDVCKPISGFTLDERPHLSPSVGPTLSTSYPSAISSGFGFRTTIGVGQGYFTLVFVDAEESQWEGIMQIFCRFGLYPQNISRI
ncbi:hypothetical protein B0H11DRAFT_1939685 [Mycena galericulata]|nr:hypothetical protein B0H11DRAFT_1939685 [Mycena galericulata]